MCSTTYFDRLKNVAWLGLILKGGCEIKAWKGKGNLLIREFQQINHAHNGRKLGLSVSTTTTTALRHIRIAVISSPENDLTIWFGE